MARPIYGGWVTFTVHLALKHSLPLFKFGSRTEKNKRPFGYGVEYQNINKADFPSKGKHLITAIDKSGYEYLDVFPDGTYIVIHDPTEVIGTAKEGLIEALKRFKIVTIRKSVKDFLAQRFGLKSKLLLHPFYEYEFKKAANPSRAVSISRIDFDKHTDIILKANKQLEKPIDIYGALNRRYAFFDLKGLGLAKYYKGQMERSFEALSDVLEDAKYVVDMSYFKHDGGGTQYTFLEAIYEGCALVLHSKWIENYETPFVPGKNCFIVDGPDALVDLLKRDPSTKSIVAAAKKILEPHIQVNWVRALGHY